MFMRNIMNISQRRATRQPTRTNSHTIQRRQFRFNNGYNSNTQYARQSNTLNNSNTNSTSENEQNVLHLPSTINYNIFNTNIDICANHLTSNLFGNSEPHRLLQNNYNRFYSTFEYESLSIRFFHNEILNLDNINDIIDDVIQNINNREIQSILNDYQDHEETQDSTFMNNTLYDDNSTYNSSEIITKIQNNITQGEYIHYSHLVKNHTCPILLSDFEKDDIISVFNLCSHAIHESTTKKYVTTFTKCPLCNHKLFDS